MTAVRCPNPKCGADSVANLTAKYDDGGRKPGKPSIVGIVMSTVVLFCLMGVIVSFIGAVLQSNQGRAVDQHVAIALVGLWLGSVVWWLRFRIRARRRFSDAATTYVYNCIRCGYRWDRRETGARPADRPGSEAGVIARAARTLEAAERRRWRDSAAWGDYYPHERDR